MALRGAELPGLAAMRHSAARRSLLFCSLLILILLLATISLLFGVKSVGAPDVFHALSGHVQTVAEAAAAKRIPRALLAMLVGAALALSGATLQAVTRNPLADPGILGVTGGAAAAVIIGIAFFGISTQFGYMGAATIGGLGAAAFVYGVGSIGRDGPTPLKLALAGAASSAAFVSLASAVLLPRVDLMQRFEFWRVGGLGGANWASLATVGPVIAAGALVVALMARPMNSLALGDELAVGLGEHVNRNRLAAAAAAVVLAAAATAVAGPIGFVGLVVPHLCRLLIGPDHRWLLPFSAAFGAVLLLASDIVGRIIARPQEIEVGIITAMLGAPFFIWIVRRHKVRAL
ncbi:iron ABC transporter permease [Leucobacter sp. CSA2]|uniref:Iron ABC transporter permease n=1 Tax=Leucobacter edaphi TaxID=2796472 RepID=A0A934QEC3_9MICO|nr:iron ABC transporter permease [Leucobacter edaphi]MBK0421809.1 iron ABC transporter permease [Leucobacter edaphi]